MPPQIQILSTVFQRLECIDTISSGNLYGIMYNGKTLIVGFSLDKEKNENNSAQLSNLFPTGIDICGMIDVGGPWPIDKANSINPDVKSRLKDIPVTNNPVYIAKNFDSDKVDVLYLNSEHLFQTPYDVLNYEDFKTQFIYLHLTGTIPVVLTVWESLEFIEEMENLASRVASGLLFQIEKSDIQMFKYTRHKDLAASIGKVYDSIEKYRTENRNMNVAHVRAFFPVSQASMEGINMCAPIMVDFSDSSRKMKLEKVFFVYDPKEKSYRAHMDLPLDCLCIAYRERALDDIYSLLIDAAEKRIVFFEMQLTKTIYDHSRFPFLKTYHFYNSMLGHPCSLIFHDSDSDEDLVSLRRAVHLSFNIPLERPYFRKGNALTFQSLESQPEVLTNVHIGLKNIPVKSAGDRMALVYGKYGYYHYKTGGKDDKGWGCAYRSLQTIYSWFRLQGYTSTEIPTHEEIQDTLVRIGDKPSTFKGSKQWIGSTEVAFVLENKLDVTSRILNINSGSEIDSLADTLLEHFEEHGTPVMIGGGSLAHTIIGVCADEDYNKISYLVLDPHYAGVDDLAAMQKQGFIGWKTKTFWSAHDFYNLCLPLRPICF